MGTLLFDQYSLLHFSVGVIAYFFGFSIIQWTIIHIMFELIENTQTGMFIINKYFKFWPGGKNYSDSFINSFGDVFIGTIGWLLAYLLDSYGIKHEWHHRKI